jgi:membrane-bound serine protease (ClpP class)
VIAALLWLAGVGCLLLELVVSSTILGVVGVLGLVGSVGLTFHQHGPLAGVALGGASALAGYVVFRLGARRLSLKTRLEAQAGFVGTDDHSALLGQTGTAATPLRPVGFATIAGRRVDVVTLGELLPAGTPVEVMAVEGNRIVVRKVEPA